MVLNKRPHLEIIQGEFIDGEFVSEAIFPGERSQRPETPVAADEGGTHPCDEMSKSSTELVGVEGITPGSLKTELNSRGISSRRFALRLGYSQSYLSKILRELKPMPAHIAVESKRLLASWDQ